MKDALLLVFANKQDITGRKCQRSSLYLDALVDRITLSDLSPEEITNALQLTKLKDKLWYVVPSIATEGTGIFEGLVSHSFPPHFLY